MRRLILPALLAYGLIFWALIAFRGEILALIIPLVITMGAALFFGPEQPRLSASRMLSEDRVSEGREVRVICTVTNNGARLEDVWLEDRVPPGLELIEGDAALLTTLAPGHSVELAYTVRGGRGSYEFPGVYVRAVDHFGLVGVTSGVEAEGDGTLYILPRVQRLRAIAIRPRQTRVFAGSIPARVGGAGVEFFGVREYHPADPLRHINWHANARHPDALFSTEYQQERIADVGLILDARQRTNIHSAGRDLFEQGVLAAAALADEFLSGGNRVGLLLYGHSLDWTVPGYGKVQRERILRALSRAEPGDSQVFDRLRYLPTRFFPARSQLVLISPLVHDDLEFLVRLRGQGYELLIVSPNPISFELAGLPMTLAVHWGARIATIERALLFRRLRQAGVRLVDWDIDQPLDQAISASLARQPVWTHLLQGVGL